MGPFSFLFAWYNAPFLVALGCCLLFALMQVVAGFGDNDADADVDADSDVDVDADMDAEVDAESGVDAADTGDGFSGALAALGIGQVPVMLVLIVLLGSLGAIGLIANTLLITSLRLPPALALAISLVGGLGLAVLITGRASRALGKVAGNVSTAVSFEQLVGRAGVVVSPSVSPSYGKISVRDSHGSLHTVFAVTKGERLPEQSEVALVSYDAARRVFIVKELRMKN
jgi:Protein of unknown function (DUF1449)